jgi:glycosyltransferase involved in cell wall biosynthesis
MKILIVTQYFYPENFKSNDLAFELRKRGHEVTVLTGLPNYPTGKLFSGYGLFRNRKQTIDGVKIMRALMVLRGKSGKYRLFLNYISWAFFASIRVLKLINKRYDAIIVHEPSPITQGIPAVFLKKLTNIPVYFWVLDLWPETLESVGGIKNKFLLALFNKLTVFIYRNSDKILISSRGFKESILEKGDFGDKLIYFPNWAEAEIVNGNGGCKYKIPTLPSGFKVMFAGNIGSAQDMPAILKAANELRGYKEIKFIIVGDGRFKKWVEVHIEKYNLKDTVFLLGKFPLAAMRTLFDNVDALLVSLKSELIFRLTVPSKIQAYMAAGKPILTMLDGEGTQIIKDSMCGYCANAGDYHQLAKNIKLLYSAPKQELEKMGERAFKYYQENFRLEDCIGKLEKIISRR